MPLEPVWYRIRLAFSHLIKLARPFDIDISLVSPPGQQVRVSCSSVYIYKKQYKAKWWHLHTEVFLCECESLAVFPGSGPNKSFDTGKRNLAFFHSNKWLHFHSLLLGYRVNMVIKANPLTTTWVNFLPILCLVFVFVCLRWLPLGGDNDRIMAAGSRLVRLRLEQHYTCCVAMFGPWIFICVHLPVFWECVCVRPHLWINHALRQVNQS